MAAASAVLVQGEKLLDLDEASRLIAGNPHKNTLRRWASKGLRGHRLRTIRVGRRIATTKRFLDEFFAQCSEEFGQSAVESTDAHRAAEQRLDAEGVK